MQKDRTSVKRTFRFLNHITGRQFPRRLKATVPLANFMEFPELIHHLFRRPGMWVQPPLFSSVLAFIRGYDHARDGGPLAGFHEWFVVRANGGDNLSWEGLVLLLLLPDADRNRLLTAEQEAVCLQGLTDLFEEFFGFRQEHGITKVHHDYARWLLKQRWYEGSLRKKKEDPSDEASFPPS